MDDRKEKEKEERKNGVWKYFSLIFQKLGEQLFNSYLISILNPIFRFNSL